MLKQLWFKVILGMFLGVLFGLVLSPSAFAFVSKDVALAIAPWVALIGNIFLATVKMVVVPLVMSSIILGITSAKDTQTLKKTRLTNSALFCIDNSCFCNDWNTNNICNAAW